MAEYFNLDAGTRDSIMVTSPRVQAAIDMLHSHFSKFSDPVPTIPAKSSRRRHRYSDFASAASSSSDDEETPGSSVSNIASTLRTAPLKYHSKSSSISTSTGSTGSDTTKLEIDFGGIDEAIFELIQPTQTAGSRHRDAVRGYKESREQRRQVRLMKHNNLQVSWI